MKSTFYSFCLILIGCFLHILIVGNVRAGSQLPENVGNRYDEWEKKAEKGLEDPIINWHYYWKEGFHIDSTKKNLRIKLNGKIMVDGGYIGADDELESAFPDLEGSDVGFRKLSLILSGSIGNILEGKFEIDFAILRDIQDNWVRFTFSPLLKHFRFGNMKEPFSLEEQIPITYITFMENALPGLAFSPGRNIGIRYDSSALEERITLAAGAFWNTGSFGEVGEGKNQMSDANGYNLTARATGIPWYEENGRKLLHLGLSYSHGFRDGEVINRARPESRLTDDRLVDTGEFFADGKDMISAEFAAVSGPLSLQGEYFNVFWDADVVDDPHFWGFYLYGSYFLTGEHRGYDNSNGTFSMVKPNHNFNPRAAGWGAWELGLRLSYVDLNDEGIRGGKERNFTAGLNWYLNPETRFMFNYIRANVEDRETPQPVDDGSADIFQVRFQVKF